MPSKWVQITRDDLVTSATHLAYIKYAMFHSIPSNTNGIKHSVSTKCEFQNMGTWDLCHFYDFRLSYAKVKRTLSMKPLYSLLSTVKCI